MKKLLLLIGLFLYSTSISLASPFLVADPQPVADVTLYVVSIGGMSYNSAPVPLPSDATKVTLKFDLAGKWTTGNNSLTVKAVNELYGEESSLVPFSFTVSKPSNITGAKIIK